MTEKKKTTVKKTPKKGAPKGAPKNVPEEEKTILAALRKKPIWLRALAFVAWTGAVFFALEFIIARIFVFILPDEALSSNVVNAIYQGVTFAACLAVTIIVPWKVLGLKTTREEIGLKGLPTWTDVLLAPVVFVATMLLAGALTAGLMAIFPSINWDQTQNVGFSHLSGFGDYAIAFIFLVVVAPVCEEIIFRGWLYGKLRARISAVPAVLLVSLLFALLHGQVNVGVTVFAMSIGMCIQRELTGTIWSGMALHMIKNAIAFYFLFASVL